MPNEYAFAITLALIFIASYLGHIARFLREISNSLITISKRR